MKRFLGFRAGREHQVALPASFFTELLPLVDNLNELKVTLACWRILMAKTGALRFVHWEDLLTDEALGGLDEAAVRDGLERAVARGALLSVRASHDSQAENWYFANTAKGRKAVAALQKGQLPDGITPDQPVELQPERPNIFALYEQTVGLLSPLIADELRDAEATYPPGWIEEAFREAARQNVRSWAYVRKILEKRAQRGRQAQPGDGDASDAWRRFLRGES